MTIQNHCVLVKKLKIYPDFNGYDDESYIVLYDGNEAFYE